LSAAVLTHWAVLGAVVLLTLAALWDLFTLTIPNTLVLALLVLYPLSLVEGFDLSILAADAGAAGAIFVFCMVCFSFGWIGGGDAKLAPVAALWAGYGNLATFALATTVSGAVLAFALLISRRLRAAVGGGRPGSAWPLMAPDAPVPYGVAICVGGTAILVGAWG
jgi:prepilin peptidase CpaA